MKLIESLIMKLLYSCRAEKTFKNTFDYQLKNAWGIDKEIDKKAKSILDKHDLFFKPYSEEHFNILYELIEDKLSKMSDEKQIIYLEFRKKHFEVLGDNRGFEFILSFFFGSSFTGIVNYFSEDKTSNVLFMVALIVLVLIYFGTLISPKISFNKSLISAIEKNIINKEQNKNQK